MKAQFDHTIHLTLKYYGLPREGSGKVRGGWFHGESASWSPEFFDRSAEEQKELVLKSSPSKGEDRYLKTEFKKDGPGAMTWADGDVHVYLELFQQADELKNPRFLAYSLYHEWAHFDELVSRGWGGGAAKEVSAYARSLKAAESMGLLPAEIAKYKLAQAKKREQALREKPVPTWMEELVEARWKEEWLDKKKELDAIRDQRERLRERLEKDREERWRREAGQAVPAPIGAARPELPGETVGAVSPWTVEYERLSGLKELAVAACASPGSVKQAYLDSKFSWYPSPFPLSHPYLGQSPGLSGCSKEFYTLLVKWSGETDTGKITEQWLTEFSRSLAAKYASPPPSAPEDPVPGPTPTPDIEEGAGRGGGDNPDDYCFNEPGIGRVCPRE